MIYTIETGTVLMLSLQPHMLHTACRLNQTKIRSWHIYRIELGVEYLDFWWMHFETDRCVLPDSHKLTSELTWLEWYHDLVSLHRNQWYCVTKTKRYYFAIVVVVTLSPTGSVWCRQHASPPSHEACSLGSLTIVEHPYEASTWRFIQCSSETNVEAYLQSPM